MRLHDLEIHNNNTHVWEKNQDLVRINDETHLMHNINKTVSGSCIRIRLQIIQQAINKCITVYSSIYSFISPRISKKSINNYPSFLSLRQACYIFPSHSLIQYLESNIYDSLQYVTLSGQFKQLFYTCKLTESVNASHISVAKCSSCPVNHLMVTDTNKWTVRR